MASLPTEDPENSTLNAPSAITEEDKISDGGLWAFFATLLGLIVIDLLVATVQVPNALVLPASVLITAVVFAIPILALYKAASANWSMKLVAILFLSGVAVQAGLVLLVSQIPVHLGFVRAVLLYTSQAGLLTWCLGLGAFVALIIKEKNLILPVAIFLAAFDVFLVLTPIGPTQAIMKQHPEVLQTMAYGITKVQSAPNPTHGPVRMAAFVGPADLLFISTFFIVIHRFKMRTKATLKFLLPTLLAYLGVVLLFGHVHVGPFALAALPALLPIGSVVILVNLPEWKLNGEEKISTLVVALLAIGLVAFGLTRKPAPAPREEPTAPHQRP